MRHPVRNASWIPFALAALFAPAAPAATCTSFNVAPTFIHGGPAAGSTSVTITGSPSGCTGGSWTASSLGWAVPSPASGSGSATITVSWQANPGYGRTGTMTIAGKSITVSQDGAICDQYNVYNTSNSVSSAAGSFQSNIVGIPTGCQRPWTATANASWLSVTPTSGNGSATLNISYTQNTGGARSSSVTFACDYCSPSIDIAVSQAAYSPGTCSSYAISPTSVSPSSAAGSQSVTVSGVPSGCSGGSWAASSNASWISVSPSSGTLPGSTTVSFTQNTGAARSGTATIAGKTFTVSQGAASGGSCTPDANSLCLLGNRFRVTASYGDYGGGSGSGKAVSVTSDTGYFWFFNSANVEAVVKMVSFCGSGTNNVGVYATGLTDLAVNIVVTDTATSSSKTYTNALGNPFRLIRDGPFICLPGLRGEEAPEATAEPPRFERPVPEFLVTPQGTCTPDANTLCLVSNRFKVTASYKTYSGTTGTGKAVSLTSDTGYFWFFSSTNVEVVAKLVNFCGSGTNRWGVYANGLTDLEVTLTVTDMQTGQSAVYTNALGNLFLLIRNAAFACP